MQITNEPYGESSLIVTMCFNLADAQEALERPRLDLLRMLHLSDTADWLNDIERFLTDKEILTYFVQKLGEGTALAWAEDNDLTLMFTPDILVTEDDAPHDITQLIGPTSDTKDSTDESVITVRALVYLKPAINMPQDMVSRGTSTNDMCVTLGQVRDYLIDTDLIPSDLLDKQTDILRDRLNAQLAAQNLTLKEYCRNERIKPQSVEEDLHDQAVDALVDFMAQDMLFDIMGIHLTDEDIQKACAQYAHAQNLDKVLQTELYTQLKETHRMYLVENYARQAYVQNLVEAAE